MDHHAEARLHGLGQGLRRPQGRLGVLPLDELENLVGAFVGALGPARAWQ
jgi:hypothetical protein